MKLTIELTVEQYQHIQAIADYYEVAEDTMVEMILHDELYEMSKGIDEDGVYEPM